MVFLDIMGFKERVARNSADDHYKELTAFNRDILKIISSVSGVEVERDGEQEGFSDAALISEDARDAIMLAQPGKRFLSVLNINVTRHFRQQ